MATENILFVLEGGVGGEEFGSKTMFILSSLGGTAKHFKSKEYFLC